MTTQTAPGLPANAVEKLLAQSGVTLDAEARAALDRDLYPIGLWYLIPAAQRAADARHEETYRRLLGDERAQLVVTDPPSGCASTVIGGGGRVVHENFVMGSAKPR